jgi:NADH dehydrogenase
LALGTPRVAIVLVIPHVVILGGGFGGLSAARALGGAPVRVTLVDLRHRH